MPLVVLLVGCGGDDSAVGESSTAAAETAAASTSTSGTPVQCEEGMAGAEDGAEDSGFGMGDDMPLPLTVYEAQQGSTPQGTLVRLVDVVVTTPSATTELERGYELFVQELEGGPYSGLRINTRGFDPGAMLSVGSTVEVVGRLERYGSWVVLEVDSSADVVVTGSAPLPEPVVVSVVDLRPDQPDARSYEGVQVRVEMATVTDDDPCDGEFILDDAARVDDRFVPGSLASPEQGQVLMAVQGVLVFTADGYELAPPDASAVN